MPSCEYMCLECGHSFEVFTTSDEDDEGNEVECPLCGSTQTTRTYQDGLEPDDDEQGEDGNGDDEEDDLGPISDDE